MELHDYLRVIRKWWILIVACGLAAAAAAAMVTKLPPAVYTSEARLFIARTDEPSNRAYDQGMLSVQRMPTYASLASGRELAQRVVDDLGLDTTADGLVGQISGAAEPDSVLLRVRATNPDPELAQRIAASASEQLIEMVEQLETPPGVSESPINATVVDSAGPASVSPTGFNRKKIAAGFVLGLLLGLGIAVLRELFRLSADPSPDAVPDPTRMRDGSPLSRPEAPTH